MLIRRYFDEDAANSFEHASLMFRFCFNELARAALERSLPRYHMRPKLHVFEHFSAEFRYKNPKYFMNYLGEDAVRRVKALATMSPARQMSHHVTYRYCLQMCLLLR